MGILLGDMDAGLVGLVGGLEKKGECKDGGYISY